jgi:hypothetical protein
MLVIVDSKLYITIMIIILLVVTLLTEVRLQTTCSTNPFIPSFQAFVMQLGNQDLNVIAQMNNYLTLQPTQQTVLNTQ